jgi:hypothetical protein
MPHIASQTPQTPGSGGWSIEAIAPPQPQATRPKVPSLTTLRPPVDKPYRAPRAQGAWHPGWLVTLTRVSKLGLTFCPMQHTLDDRGDRVLIRQVAMLFHQPHKPPGRRRVCCYNIPPQPRALGPKRTSLRGQCPPTRHTEHWAQSVTRSGCLCGLGLAVTSGVGFAARNSPAWTPTRRDRCCSQPRLHAARKHNNGRVRRASQ